MREPRGARDGFPSFRLLALRRLGWLVVLGTLLILGARIAGFLFYGEASFGSLSFALLTFTTAGTACLLYAIASVNRARRAMEREIAERRAAERNLKARTRALAVIQTVAIAANESVDFETAARACLDAVCTYAGWAVGHTYERRHANDPTLQSTSAWFLRDPERYAGFRALTEGTRFGFGDGLPGRVLLSSEPIDIPDLASEETFVRAKAATEAGLRAGCGFPVRVGNEVAAVLEFFSPEPMAPVVEYADLLSVVAAQLARVIERRRAGEVQARLANLFACSVDAIVAVDEKGRITDWNEGARQLLGYTADEIRGRSVTELHAVGAAIRPESILVEGRSVSQLETRRTRKDGTEVDVSISIAPLRDSSGRIIGASAVMHDITERKEREQALRRSQEQLEMAQAVAHMGSWEWELPTNTVSWSEEMFRILGFAPRSLTPSYDLYMGLIPEDERAIVEDVIRRSLERGDTVAFDHRTRRVDGSIRMLQIRGFVARDPDGNARVMYGTAQDVTEMREAERLLVQSEGRFRLLFASNPLPMWVYDLESLRLLEVNDAAVAAYGYGRDELLAMTALDVRPEKERDAFVARIEALRGRPSGLLEEGEQQHRRRDGSTLVVECTSYAFESQGRNVALTVIVDVTAKKRALREVAEREAEFRRLVSSLPDAIWSGEYVPGDAPRVRYVSPVVERLTGYPMAELQTLDQWRRLVHPEDRASFEAALSRLGRFVDTPESTEYRIRTADGRIRWLRDTLVTSPDAVTGVMFVNGVLSDITDSKQAEMTLRQTADELKRSNRDLEAFAYVASHDLQEPLRMVNCYLSLLSQRYGDRLDADGREFVAFAADGAQRMKALISDLLMYARVGTEQRSVRKVDTGLLLQSVLSDLKLALKESGCSVRTGALPLIDGERTELGQVFQNLVSNAIKFRGERPPLIEIGAEPIGHEWRFHVRDNGIGMNMEDAARVFQLFQRLNRRDEFPGTGVGLAICKKIVESHGGRIWVEAEIGVGSCFYFTLPRPERPLSPGPCPVPAVRRPQPAERPAPRVG